MEKWWSLNAGFDVLLFDNGYFKDMVNDPNRYGVKWVVQDRDELRTIVERFRIVFVWNE
jgi:hypothetical protein